MFQSQDPSKESNSFQGNYGHKDLSYDTQGDYKRRINKVFDFIENHLNESLTLDKLSEIGDFSPFHFHRIFKFVTKETLQSYVNRKRLEGAALELIHKSESISNIGLKYGFNDQSSFTRSFKKFYGISPSEFQLNHPHRFSKIGQTLSERAQYLREMDELKYWIASQAVIKIEEKPEMKLAYVTAIGPQNVPAAYAKLVEWAVPKGLMNNTKMVTIYYDSFKVTEAHKVRMRACMLLNETVEVAGDVGLTKIEKGKCIVGSFEITLDQYEKSWTGLFLWMTENGYKKANREPFEIYHNNFNEHPEKKAIVDFCIPVE